MTGSESRTQPLGVWDYVVTGLVLLVSVFIGLYHAFKHRKHANSNEILMASRSMGVLPVTLSILATYFSATSLLGLPAEVYMYGFQQWWFAISYMVVIPVTIYCYLPVFYDAGVTSTYEYLEFRFNSIVRRTASAIYILQTILYMVVVLYAPALALNQVTSLDIWSSVIAIGTICILYTTFGGMRAVLWTDAFQIFIMLISMAMVVIKGTLDVGGVQEVWQRSQSSGRLKVILDVDPTLRLSFWSVTIGGTFIWLSSFGVSQSLVQRYLTTKNIAVARRALWSNYAGLLLMSTIYCFGGLVIYAHYWRCDPLKNGDVFAPDQLLPLFVMDTLGYIPGMPGLFISGVFSAALSTLSSGLNGLAAVTLEDFISPMVGKLSEKRTTLLLKLIPIAYGIVTLALVAVADQIDSLVQATVTINGIVGGPLLGVFTLGMLVPWANSIGASIGMGAGFAISCWIGIGAQIFKTPSPTLPLGTSTCPVTSAKTWINSTMEIYSATTANVSDFTIINATQSDNEVLPLYKVSFLWYSTISFMTVLIIGAVISLIKGQKPTSTGCKQELLFPPIRSLLQYIQKSRSTSEITSQKVAELRIPENEHLLMKILTQDQNTVIKQT